MRDKKWIPENKYRSMMFDREAAANRDRMRNQAEQSRNLTASHLDTAAIHRASCFAGEEEMKKIEQFMTENQGDAEKVQYIHKGEKL